MEVQASRLSWLRACTNTFLHTLHTLVVDVQTCRQRLDGHRASRPTATAPFGASGVDHSMWLCHRDVTRTLRWMCHWEQLHYVASVNTLRSLVDAPGQCREVRVQNYCHECFWYPHDTYLAV
eukprot:2449640-Amphidinium_carterae.2